MTAPLSRHLENAVSEQALALTWQRISASRARDHRRAVWVGVVAAAGAVVVLVTLASHPTPPSEVRLANGAPFLEIPPDSTTSLSDGSRIETWAEGAVTSGQVELLENAQARVVLHLRSGLARFRVTPGTGRLWRVEAGALSVEVVGTVFDVRRDAHSVGVSVERGAVVVRGVGVPDGVRRLEAGQHLEVPFDHPSAGPAAMPEPAPPPPARPRVRPESTFSPPAASALTRDTPSAAIARADQARREHRLADAADSLRALVETWPTSPEAPIAAFTLANLLAEQRRSEEARAWYARALALGLEGPLATVASTLVDGGVVP